MPWQRSAVDRPASTFTSQASGVSRTCGGERQTNVVAFLGIRRPAQQLRQGGDHFRPKELQGLHHAFDGHRPHAVVGAKHLITDQPVLFLQLLSDRLWTPHQGQAVGYPPVVGGPLLWGPPGPRTARDGIGIPPEANACLRNAATAQAIGF